MTSIRLPYVSPYPINCPNCESEINENNEHSVKTIRRKRREITVVCEECNRKFKISQQPLLPDYEIERVDDN